MKDDLGKKVLPNNYKDITISTDKVIRVRQYLPIDDKIELINYVVDNSLDNTTGCFSPIRTNVFFSIGVLRQYCGINFGDENVSSIYDLLEESGIIDIVMEAIPQDEMKYMEDLLNATTADISRYNNSAAGIIRSMSGDADSLGTSLDDILQKIKNREGLEVLSEIKNVVGKD